MHACDSMSTQTRLVENGRRKTMSLQLQSLMDYIWLKNNMTIT